MEDDQGRSEQLLFDKMWTNVVSSIAGSGLDLETKRSIYRKTLQDLLDAGWTDHDAVPMVDPQMIEAFSDCRVLTPDHLQPVLEKLYRTMANLNIPSDRSQLDEKYDQMWCTAKDYVRFREMRLRLLDEAKLKEDDDVFDV